MLTPTGSTSQLFGVPAVLGRRGSTQAVSSDAIELVSREIPGCGLLLPLATYLKNNKLCQPNSNRSRPIIPRGLSGRTGGLVLRLCVIWWVLRCFIYIWYFTIVDYYVRLRNFIDISTTLPILASSLSARSYLLIGVGLA